MTIDAFTTTGSHTWTNPGVDEVEVLIVGGGGAGGGSLGGGGGSGGVIHKTAFSVSGDQNVTVGSGGVADSYTGEAGEDSVFGSLTALGGGAGFSGDDGTNPPERCNGGSGGGGSRYGGNDTVGNPGGDSLDQSQGSDGGEGAHGGSNSETNQEGGGGGGGFSETGGNTQDYSTAGPGGDGYQTNILGTSYYFAGGGGGCAHDNGGAGAGDGGIGGGGGGGATGDAAGSGGIGYNSGEDGTSGSGGSGVGGDGAPNTGGGGGGAGWDSAVGGDGGSGIVVVKYLDPRLEMLRSPVNVLANNITGSSADISWSDKSENENGFRVYLSEDSTSWTEESDLSSNTELYSLSGLENGEQYSTKIEAYNTDRTATDTTPINKIVSTSTTISEQNTTIVFANPETISGTMNVSNTKTIDGTTIIQL